MPPRGQSALAWRGSDGGSAALELHRVELLRAAIPLPPLWLQGHGEMIRTLEANICLAGDVSSPCNPLALEADALFVWLESHESLMLEQRARGRDRPAPCPPKTQQPGQDSGASAPAGARAARGGGAIKAPALGRSEHLISLCPFIGGGEGGVSGQRRLLASPGCVALWAPAFRRLLAKAGDGVRVGAGASAGGSRRCSDRSACSRLPAPAACPWLWCARRGGHCCPAFTPTPGWRGQSRGHPRLPALAVARRCRR